jgi:hypothetical protein
VLADGRCGVGAHGVEEPDGVGLGVSWRMASWPAQRKAVTSPLVVSWPPVILQRKTRAMMPRGMFL